MEAPAGLIPKDYVAEPSYGACMSAELEEAATKQQEARHVKHRVLGKEHGWERREISIRWAFVSGVVSGLPTSDLSAWMDRGLDRRLSDMEADPKGDWRSWEEVRDMINENRPSYFGYADLWSPHFTSSDLLVIAIAILSLLVYLPIGL